jgi:hypothetical protein
MVSCDQTMCAALRANGISADDLFVLGPTSKGPPEVGSDVVDSRLLRALAALARHQPVSIVRFGNTGPGASVGVPLRFADLAGNDPAGRLSGTAYARSVRAYPRTVSTAF